MFLIYGIYLKLVTKSQLSIQFIFSVILCHTDTKKICIYIKNKNKAKKIENYDTFIASRVVYKTGL